ncbi:MAG TPA: hypothetical protein VGL94_22855 [Ktedonobacteraceae bacterium]
MMFDFLIRQFIPRGHTVARVVGAQFTVCPLGIAPVGWGGACGHRLNVSKTIIAPV